MFKKLLAWFLKFDKQVNHYLLGGNKGETISSRLGRHIKYRNCNWCKLFCRGFLWILGPIAKNKNWFRHCKESIQSEFE